MGTVGPWSELDALASALDHHHIIANQVHDLHARSKDAALAGYLEQQFTGKHANKIRELSGLLTNLVPMYKESAGRDLAHYLFDQKLLLKKKPEESNLYFNLPILECYDRLSSQCRR